MKGIYVKLKYEVLVLINTKCAVLGVVGMAFVF
jgi:hypothetical protein